MSSSYQIILRSAFIYFCFFNRKVILLRKEASCIFKKNLQRGLNFRKTQDFDWLIKNLCNLIWMLSETDNKFWKTLQPWSKFSYKKKFFHLLNFYSNISLEVCFLYNVLLPLSSSIKFQFLILCQFFIFSKIWKDMKAKGLILKWCRVFKSGRVFEVIW